MDLLGGGASQIEAVVTVRLDTDSQDLGIRSDSILPGSLRVEVEGGGAMETVLAGSISGLGTTRATFESPIAFQHDSEYVVRVIVDGQRITERTFHYLEKDLFEPQEDVRATYAITMEESDAATEFEVSGTGTMEQSGDDLRLDLEGTGSMTMEDGGFTMELQLHEVRFTDVNDRTTAGTMSATGTWSIEDDGFSGEGTVDQAEITFLGAESHVDGAGVVRDADKDRFQMQMSGAFTADGTTGDMASETDETTWSDPDDGLEFWREGYEETEFTIDGETFTDREEYDEAVEEAEAEPDLSDMLPDEGPFVWPPVTGDSFVHEGSDVRIGFNVRRGGEVEVDGQSVATWVVEGAALSGAQGSEEIVVVAHGVFAGLPFSYDQRYTRGQMAASMTMDLQQAG